MIAPPSATNWKDIVSVVESVATTSGLVAAGIWAYFNFIKSRTYHPRMEMTVSGELRFAPNGLYLVPRITLKNIGNSKIALIQSGSGYRVWFAAQHDGDMREVEWTDGKPVFPIFKLHDWIEPGESIFDEARLIRLPQEIMAAKIEARLVAQTSRFPRPKNNEWNGTAIVGPVA